MTKLLFEGQGANVRQGLYKQFQLAYQDTVFLISTNGLPATEEQGRDKNFQDDVWYPLCTRIDFTRMLHKHHASEEFPTQTSNWPAPLASFAATHSSCAKTWRR